MHPNDRGKRDFSIAWLVSGIYTALPSVFTRQILEDSRTRRHSQRGKPHLFGMAWKVPGGIGFRDCPRNLGYLVPKARDDLVNVQTWTISARSGIVPGGNQRLHRRNSQPCCRPNINSHREEFVNQSPRSESRCGGKGGTSLPSSSSDSDLKVEVKLLPSSTDLKTRLVEETV